MNNFSLNNRVKSIEVKKRKSISDLLSDMKETGFQGRKLAEVSDIFKKMVKDPNVTILFGYSGSLSVAGQWKLIKWLIENRLIDILVSTGANISEDIVEAMGFCYYKGASNASDYELYKEGLNRYLDIFGKESDYLEMTMMISEFIASLELSINYSSREFLYLFGRWLLERNVNCIVSQCAKYEVPIYCPAISDSPFGDAALIAKSKGFDLKIDAIKDYVEFIGLGKLVKDTGVVYIGGGVPKDFIQLFAVSGDLLYQDRKVPGRAGKDLRKGTNETYYPHKYAIQITTDSPQWGGLSGCTFEEAISWGKVTVNGEFAQCYCDATIALPIIIQDLVDSYDNSRKYTDLSHLFCTF